jgi:hypothetical protein
MTRAGNAPDHEARDVRSLLLWARCRVGWRRSGLRNRARSICSGGKLRSSVRHAWNIGPNGEITYHYIPDGPEHEAERQAVAAVIGEPASFEDDPERDGDREATDWLEGACHPEP